MLRYQKQMRELEADIMKDFPYWEAGTFFGTQIYESVPEDTYIELLPGESYTYVDPFTIPIMKTLHLET